MKLFRYRPYFYVWLINITEKIVKLRKINIVKKKINKYTHLVHCYELHNFSDNYIKNIICLISKICITKVITPNVFSILL